MGFISDYKKAQRRAKREFQKKHPIIAALSGNYPKNDPYSVAKRKADREFAKNHPIIYGLAKNQKTTTILKNVSKKQDRDLKKRMDNLDLFDEERDAVINEGYEPEDFEDEERDPDDYYNDEY